MKPMKYDPKITEICLRIVEAYGDHPPVGPNPRDRQLYEKAIAYLIPQIPAVQVVVPPPTPLP